MVVGRGEDVDVFVDHPRVSRRHALIRVRERVVWLEDLGSRNGTRVNGEPTLRRVLEHGDLVELGGRCSFRFALQDPTEAAFQSTLYETSVQEPESGLFNARYFVQRLEAECAYARRHGSSVAVFLFEAPRPPQPERVPEATDVVARVLRAVCLPEQAPARLGVTRFGLIAPGFEEGDASVLADRVRRRFAQRAVDPRGPGLRTGFAVAAGATATSEHLREGAEAQLLSSSS
jgi:two-component system cell cycle response regulator